MENQSHNLDLSIPQSAMPNATECKINIQANAITDLIYALPYYFENQCENLSKLHEAAIEECKNNSDIDEDSCNRQLEDLQTHHSFLIEQQRQFKIIANHAIFLLVFAYFESIVTHIKVSQGLPPVFGLKKTDVTEIMDKYSRKLTPESEEALDYLVGTVKELRNLLTHNYNGSADDAKRKNYSKQLKIAETEHAKNNGFVMFSKDNIVIRKEYLLHIQSKIDIVIQAIYKGIK